MIESSGSCVFFSVTYEYVLVSHIGSGMLVFFKYKGQGNVTFEMGLSILVCITILQKALKCRNSLELTGPLIKLTDVWPASGSPGLGVKAAKRQ